MVRPLLATIFVLSTSAAAAGELDYFAGDWVTYDQPFANDGLRISDNGDGTLRLQYCRKVYLRSGECREAHDYEGVIRFNDPDFVVQEGGGSPTPSYPIEKHRDDPNKFRRHWGDQTILYFRLPD